MVTPIRLRVPHRYAVTLKNLTVTGMVQLLIRDPNKKLDVEIDGLDIVSADAISVLEGGTIEALAKHRERLFFKL